MSCQSCGCIKPVGLKVSHNRIGEYPHKLFRFVGPVEGSIQDILTGSEIQIKSFNKVLLGVDMGQGHIEPEVVCACVSDVAGVSNSNKVTGTNQSSSAYFFLLAFLFLASAAFTAAIAI